MVARRVGVLHTLSNKLKDSPTDSDSHMFVKYLKLLETILQAGHVLQLLQVRGGGYVLYSAQRVKFSKLVPRRTHSVSALLLVVGGRRTHSVSALLLVCR